MPPQRRDVREATARLVDLDPAFALVVAHGERCALRRPSPPRAHFAELARSVCYQQLAGAAARTIHGRFDALFDGEPTPEAVLDLPVEALRGCGLSGSKAASIRDLAEKAVTGEVRLGALNRMADDAVVAELVKVRGIGPWTAHMFLMFQLGRLDVWPVGDYGVRKGWSVVHGLGDLPTEREMAPLGAPLSGVRSVAAWYCWQAVDTVLPTP